MPTTEEIYEYAARSPRHFAQYRLLTNTKDWSGVLTPDDVQDMYDRQDGCCAYTGWPMNCIVGHPWVMSLDHIVPLSRGGTSEASNAQLVCWIINRAKWSMPHDLFLSICRATAERHPWTVDSPLIRYGRWREGNGCWDDTDYDEED